MSKLLAFFIKAEILISTISEDNGNFKNMI